jgi:3-phosphoshikimate 1-carboxyvinyltransferase
MGDAPWVVARGGPLRGELRVPGDKSISHRAILFNLVARRPAVVRGLLDSEDVHATVRAARALGADLTRVDGGVRVSPPAALVEPDGVLDCGNSGTTMRLLAGLVAAEPIFAVLTGDASLRRRPMARVVEPLRAMGATVDGRAGGDRPPLAIRGPVTRAVAHPSPVASAQVVTALLLAGRRTGASVYQPGPARDHTQRMLAAMGVDIEEADGWIKLRPSPTLDPLDVDVPGDFSAAAFWLVAATITPGSDLTLRDVGINPTRTGALDVLRAMGARIEILDQRDASEPTADLRVRHAELRGVRIAGDLSLRSLDELPVLAVAAAFATGATHIRDASELRVKESDRIGRVASGLRALGVDVEEHEDGMTIHGGRPRGPATVDATGDHRVAMAFAVAALVAGPVSIVGARSVRSSYPAFPTTLEALRGA